MISIERSLKILEMAAAGSRLPVESVPVRESVGRVLAEDAISRLNLPPFNKSAMDGFAVPAGEVLQQYEIIETVPAGQSPTRDLRPGTAVKVMTGAPVPRGAGSVIMLEHTSQEGNVLKVEQYSGRSNICREAEDIRAGEVVLGAGSRVAPLEVAVLLGCGLKEIRVSERVRVAVLSTGSEIVDRPEELSPGRIMNTNGPVLAELGKAYGMDVVLERLVPDTLSEIRDAVAEAVDTAHLTIISGGVSAGDYDYVKPALRENGLKMLFEKVAIKPGRPVTAAVGKDRLVIGLPGSPVPVYLMFHLFVAPVAELLTGEQLGANWCRLVAGEDFKKKKKRKDIDEFVPVRIDSNGKVRPVEYHGTAHLAALTRASGFGRLERGKVDFPRGTPIEVMLLVPISQAGPSTVADHHAW